MPASCWIFLPADRYKDYPIYFFDFCALAVLGMGKVAWPARSEVRLYNVSLTRPADLPASQPGKDATTARTGEAPRW
jgi:hypothetical protein